MNGENPFINEGEEQLGAEEELLYCWKDVNRVCNLDCVAFDERSLDDDRFNACILLNTKRATSRALATIGHELKRQNDFYESDARKELERANQKRVEAEAYAQKLKDLDKPLPEVKT